METRASRRGAPVAKPHCVFLMRPPATSSPRNTETGRNNHIFLHLLAIPLMKSAQISEVAQKFPCCIILKTLDQRQEPFINLSLQISSINSRRTKGNVLYKHVADGACRRPGARRANPKHGELTETFPICCSDFEETLLHLDPHYEALKGSDLW